MSDTKSAGAAAKKPAKKRVRNRAKAGAGNGLTADTAGVGNVARPGNSRVPESVLMKRPGTDNPEGTKVTDTASVQGDQALMVIDVANSKPVKVIVLEGKALTKNDCGTLVLVESGPVMDVMSYETAKKKFAQKKDGTVIYGQKGFDDVPHADFDMVDIVKLVEHNN